MAAASRDVSVAVILENRVMEEAKLNLSGALAEDMPRERKMEEVQ
jgi:hypothetical protein